MFDPLRAIVGAVTGVFSHPDAKTSTDGTNPAGKGGEDSGSGATSSTGPSASVKSPTTFEAAPAASGSSSTMSNASSTATGGAHPKHVRSGSHDGKLDDRINDLHGDIDRLNIVDKAVGVAKFIPLFGLAAPLIDAVAGKKVNSELTKKQDELKDTRALNLLSDTLYALGAPMSVVNAIEGGQKIVVVEDSKLESDAEYDTKTGEIRVRQSLIDQTTKQLGSLQKQGIVSEDGQVKDTDKLIAAEHVDTIVKTGTLIGAHEAEHATQDANGTVTQFNSARQQLSAQYGRFMHSLGSEDRSDIMSSIEEQTARLEIRLLELPAYRRQELIQIQTGTPGRLSLTVDRQGQELPEDQAVENIYAFQRDLPLPYGPTAGLRPSDFDANGNRVSSGSSANDDQLDGGRFPGGRFPGGRFPGGRFPGEVLFGGRFPGGRFPGGRFPGGRFPGEIV